ncbi:MAG: hypothetical protein FDZ75_07380 [Actinobacteria bacterium]|nr:MAG: hypothetical protein FDZ75_07380 [Actinomycetota bacterium]
MTWNRKHLGPLLCAAVMVTALFSNVAPALADYWGASLVKLSSTGKTLAVRRSYDQTLMYVAADPKGVWTLSHFNGGSGGVRLTRRSLSGLTTKSHWWGGYWILGLDTDSRGNASVVFDRSIRRYSPSISRLSNLVNRLPRWTEVFHLDRAGRIYIEDAGHQRITRISRAGAMTGDYAPLNCYEPHETLPADQGGGVTESIDVDFAADSAGNLFAVTESTSSVTVSKFSAQGSLVDTWAAGFGHSDVEYPKILVNPSGTVSVLRPAAGKIITYTAAGKYLRTISVPRERVKVPYFPAYVWSHASDFAVNPAGGFWVIRNAETF